MSGRALFKFDPTLFKDDEDAADNDVYEERIEEEEEEKRDDEAKALRDGDAENAQTTAAVDADLFQDGGEEEPDFE